MSAALVDKIANYAKRMTASGDEKKENLKSGVSYEEVFFYDLSVSLFDRFNRHQEVKWCWRKKNGIWALHNIPFVEEWGHDDIVTLVNELKHTLHMGGIVLGAFADQCLVGFASLENECFGPDLEYVQLSNLHVSFEHRGKGVGKKLFKMACHAASMMDAKKLYISAQSSEETQAFYKSLKCCEAAVYNDRLAMAEPCDCQLEFAL